MERLGSSALQPGLPSLLATARQPQKRQVITFKILQEKNQLDRRYFVVLRSASQALFVQRSVMWTLQLEILVNHQLHQGIRSFGNPTVEATDAKKTLPRGRKKLQAMALAAGHRSKDGDPWMSCDQLVCLGQFSSSLAGIVFWPTPIVFRGNGQKQTKEMLLLNKNSHLKQTRSMMSCIIRCIISL